MALETKPTTSATTMAVPGATPEQQLPSADIETIASDGIINAGPPSRGNSTHKSTTLRTSSLIAARRFIPQVELELCHVTYAPMTVTAHNGGDSEQKRRVVLSDVSTRVSPNKLHAWIGPSGSGKTSLISVAAGLTDAQDLIQDSVVMVNGEEGKIPKRLVGVVWQDDLMLPNLTVEETIYFSARLKTPNSVTDEEVRMIVEEVMQDLGVLHIRHSLIGNATSGVRGISGGERKRVSVASELVVRPPLLFLDEPTSGLDATSAQALVNTLKELAHMGHSIAVVIHQPRTAIYTMFDSLLLLSKGRTIYNGPACGARAHLEACSTVERLPAETGIADWMMDVISADEERSGGPKLPEHWLNADKTTMVVNATAADEHDKLYRRPSLADLRKVPKFETSFWVQLKLLSNRTLKQQRGERLTLVAAILTFTYSFLTSLFWWRIPDNTNFIYERNSLLFFMLIAQSNQVVIGSMQTFSRESALLHRERAKKMYRVLPFFIAKTLSDMTNNVFMPMIYGMIVYWTANLRSSAGAFFMYLLSYYLTMSTAQSMGLFLSIAIPNVQIALILAPAITLFFMILGGFYIPIANINVAIRWATWLSFARYGYSSQLVNEFGGRLIPCSPTGVAINIGGSDECPLPGEEVLNSLGIEGISTNYWFNIGMIVILQVFFRVAAYALLRRSK
jgi:ABC-type multidrug transport system ATPase subunit/ABC-type multidrug transport system permease subunit